MNLLHKCQQLAKTLFFEGGSLKTITDCRLALLPGKTFKDVATAFNRGLCEGEGSLKSGMMEQKSGG